MSWEAVTMTDPITPPPELVQQWKRTAPHILNDYEHYHYITICAAQWGVDMELEACCEWVEKTIPSWAPHTLNEQLRAARRPKRPSLKEQALGALYAIATGADDTREFHQDVETIKTALEALDD